MTALTQQGSNLLRGIAIIAVVSIHFFGGFPGLYSSTSPYLNFYVTLDQLARFCVPLFVALSGYGLWQKYQTNSINYPSFIKRQATKFIPLYLLTTLLSYFIFKLVPQWQLSSSLDSLFIQIIAGRADYHLYFLPMIFQFYLLFPILLKIVQKFRGSSLLVSAIFQLWLYQLYSHPPSYFVTDQQQYLWFFTWIFYFILGMHLGNITRSLKFTTLITAIILITSSISLIKQGIDPIIALRFTRISIMLYATTAIITLTKIVSTIKANSVTKLVSTIGASSYPIYLFHTLILRLFFEYFIY